MTNRSDEFAEMVRALQRRQARQDERSTRWRSAYGLRGSLGSGPMWQPGAPESILTSADAALAQIAEVVLRLQQTVAVQGELLDRIQGRALPNSHRRFGTHHPGESVRVVAVGVKFGVT